MAANLMVTLREEVPAAAMTESWMSRSLFPPRVEDDDELWEERVFQEETAGLIGVTWPPRSYSCDFCKRDFRSAQALGGHMNVHRRDRARLRQSSSTRAVAPQDHKRWIFPLPAHQETPIHYQLPRFSSSSDQKSLLYPITPDRSIVSSSQLLPSSSFMPAPPLLINSHITNDPMQQHEILPTLPSISPYSSSEHTLPTFPSSPPVSNPLTMNTSNSVHSMEISGSDRHHGRFASSMAESGGTVRKLQQARAFQPCFPVTSLRKTNKSSSEQEKRIYNIQHQEAISLGEDPDTADDELDLELRLGQTKS